MLVRMRCCPRISAREIGYTVGRRILLRIRIPDRLIRRKKNFRFEGKEENEKIRTIYETIEVESRRSSFSHDQT